MGTKVFDYLADSIFFDEHALATKFSAVNEEDLRSELTRYREFVLANVDELMLEIYACQSATKIFTGLPRQLNIEFDLLKQGAFYIEQFVLNDPLFLLTRTNSEPSKVMTEWLGMRGDPPLQLLVALAAADLKRIKTLIAADYVKVLPVSHLFEPPQQIPVYYSENFFEDALPPELMSFFHSNAVVRAMRKDGDTYVEEPSLYPARAIDVSFKNDPREHSRMYMLWEHESMSIDEDTGAATICMTMPDGPPTQESFEGWVYDSVNRTAAHIHQEVAVQFALAHKMKAAYLTPSPFEFELLRQLAPDADPSTMRSATTLLNIELPFVTDVDLEVLMNLRREERSAFERFRRLLDLKLREIATIKDPEEQRLKADDISAELIENAHGVGQVVSRAQKKLAGGATLAVAGLTAAVATGGWSIPVAVGAAAAGYTTYQEYRSATDAPAFFLWKALQRSKK